MVRRLSLVVLVASVGLAGYLMGAVSPTQPTLAQAGSEQCFTETGKCVRGRFLAYWRANGAERQQGFPISDEFEEQQAPPPLGDGKVHIVQYFQRARFEKHELAPPFDVQLGLLGSEQHKIKYGLRDVVAPGLPPGVGTRENPVPKGTTAAVGQRWALRVISVTPNANEAVKKENSYNDPPKPGHQFFIARVSLTYVAEGSGKYGGDYSLRGVGPAAVEYTVIDNDCGVVPDEMNDREVFKGGSLEGNVCWEIQAGDASGMALFDSRQPKESRVYFSMQP